MPNEVLEFWFAPERRRHWFGGPPEFDEQVRRHVGSQHLAAVNGQYARWMDEPEGALALCILFDQVPRNIYRGTPRAFATDTQAREVARHILTSGFDRSLPDDDHRMFCYLPFEHAEDLADQELAVRLFEERTGDRNLADYARRHRDIIARFGRFPHRNAVLGRPSTPDEVDFLKSPGSSF